MPVVSWLLSIWQGNQEAIRESRLSFDALSSDQRRGRQLTSDRLWERKSQIPTPYDGNPGQDERFRGDAERHFGIIPNWISG